MKGSQNPNNPYAPLGAPGYGQRSPDTTQWMLTTEDVIRQIDMLLKGAYPSVVDGEQVIIVDNQLQMINDKGRRILLSYLRQFLNKNIFLSKYDERKIALHVQNIHKKLAKAILPIHDELDVEDPRELVKIIYAISVNIESAFFRAHQGHTWKEIHRVHVVRENVERGKNKAEVPPMIKGMFEQ